MTDLILAWAIGASAFAGIFAYSWLSTERLLTRAIESWKAADKAHGIVEETDPYYQKLEALAKREKQE